MKGLVKTSGGNVGIYENGVVYSEWTPRFFDVKTTAPLYWITKPHQLLVPKGLM